MRAHYLFRQFVVVLAQIVDVDAEQNSDDPVEIIGLAERLILKVTDEVLSLLS